MGSCVVVVFLAYFFEKYLLRSVVMKLKGLFSNRLVLVTTGHRYGLDVLVSLVPWLSYCYISNISISFRPPPPLTCLYDTCTLPNHAPDPPKINILLLTPPP